MSIQVKLLEGSREVKADILIRPSCRRFYLEEQAICRTIFPLHPCVLPDTIPRKPGACRGFVPSSGWGMLCCCSFLFASRTGFSNWVLLFMWLKEKISNQDRSGTRSLRRTYARPYGEQEIEGHLIWLPPKVSPSVHNQASEGAGLCTIHNSVIVENIQWLLSHGFYLPFAWDSQRNQPGQAFWPIVFMWEACGAFK